MSKYCAVENQSSVMFRPGERFQSMTSRPGSLYGRGRSRSPSTMLKIPVFAPIPMANERIAAMVKAGAAARERRARFTSCSKMLMQAEMASHGKCTPTDRQGAHGSCGEVEFPIAEWASHIFRV